MKCKLMDQSLRVFSKAVRLISKLSNEVLIIAENNRMRLQSINDNKTAFIEIQFEDRFFTSYECNEETKCKLFMKSLILVFRVVNIDRIVNDCTLIMNEDMSRVVFQMDCKNGVNREYFLPYMESNHLRYSSDLNQNNPSFKVDAKLMFECLQNFSNETKDITIWLTRQQILFKTYFDDGEEQEIITSFAYKTRQFQDYNIADEMSVTFNGKDLKNFVEFSNFNNQNINCYFESSGRPIEFNVKSSQYYSAKLILATHEFPENQDPVPPSLPNPFSSASHSNSLISSGNLSVVGPDDQQNETSTGDTHMRVVPECVLSGSVSNNDSLFRNSNNGNQNNQRAVDNEEEDPFDDDNIIEEMLSQMPEFSIDNFDEPTNEAIINLTGTALQRYHTSVLYGKDDDDSPVQNSQDILVPESDDEFSNDFGF